MVYVRGYSLMICRSCGCIYFEKNKQEVCLRCYTGGQRKPKMVYTKKVWDKFSLEVKEKLITQHDIVLTYPKPMKQRIKEKLKGTFKRNDPVKRKERRDKLFKKLKKIAKGVTSESGNKKLKNFTAKLNDHGSIDTLVSKRKKKIPFKNELSENNKYDSLINKSKTDYSALTKRGVPKL